MIWTHVSDLAFDRLLAGELTTGEAAAVRDHAGTCHACGALLADAEDARKAFAAAPRPIWLGRRRAWPLAASGLALAAALALVIAWPHHAVPAVRTKGTAIAGFFVAHGGAVRRGSQAEAVAPGDRIELWTTTLEPSWFAAISDDANGTRSVYVEPRLIAPGREQVVPGAIELDANSEVVTGVFCPAAFDARTIDPAAPPAGCTIDRFALTKVPR
jgi:hypothetical protein